MSQMVVPFAHFKNGLTARFFLVKKRVVRPQPHNPFFYQKKTGLSLDSLFFYHKKNGLSLDIPFFTKKKKRVVTCFWRQGVARGTLLTKWQAS